MSASNGERARFHRNRHKRVVQRAKLRTLLEELTARKAANAEPAADKGKAGPALVAGA
jgi:hypothetical protein